MYDSPLQAHGRIKAALESIQFTEDVSALLREHLKGGAEPEQFSLQLSFGESGHRADCLKTQYFDDPHGITLRYARCGMEGSLVVPLGYASFRICGPRPGLMISPYRTYITQLQGIYLRGAHLPPEYAETIKEGLGRIRWERFLVRLIVLLARQLECVTEVWIQPAERNEWYRSPDYFLKAQHDALIEHNRRLQVRYNVTARRCGFALRDFVYVLPLLEPSLP